MAARPRQGLSPLLLFELHAHRLILVPVSCSSATIIHSMYRRRTHTYFYTVIYAQTTPTSCGEPLSTVCKVCIFVVWYTSIRVSPGCLWPVPFFSMLFVPFLVWYVNLNPHYICFMPMPPPLVLLLVLLLLLLSPPPPHAVGLFFLVLAQSVARPTTFIRPIESLLIDGK